MNDEEILLLPRAKLEKGKGLRLLVAFQGKRNVPVHEAKGEAPLWNVRKCHHSGLRHIPEDEESANETSQWNVTLKRLRIHNLRRDCPMIFNTWWYILLYHRNLDASQSSGSRDPTPPLLSPAQTWLSFGSGLLTVFTCRGAVKTYL
jgi:hypothetical protein